MEKIDGDLDCFDRWINLQRGRLYDGRLRGSGRSFTWNRGTIQSLSRSAAKRLRRYLRNSVAVYRVFGTLTYPPGTKLDGVLAKQHWAAFARKLSRHHETSVEAGTPQDNPYSVCWWQEWQANGRLHYHFVSSHYIHHAKVSAWWYEIVGSGNRDHLSAGTQVIALRGGREAASRYAAKYASKLKQKDVPEGWIRPGRFWGISGCRRTVAATIRHKRRDLMPPRQLKCLESVEKAVMLLESQGEITQGSFTTDSDYEVEYKMWEAHHCDVIMQTLFSELKHESD
ncbi:MAG: rolling circle replication-associated protein [Burkholderiales bacterium]